MHEKALNKLLGASCVYDVEENLGTEGGEIHVFKFDLHCNVGWVKARYLGYGENGPEYEILMVHIGNQL